MRCGLSWIFLAEGEEAFSKKNPQLLSEMVRKIKGPDLSVAFYYDPLVHTDPDFFDVFDAAFPLIDPDLQLPLKTLILKEKPPARFPQPSPDPVETDSSSVAVIVRMRNAGKILPQTLKALRSQTVKNIEIYAVDSGSQDDSVAIARRYGAMVETIAADSYFPGKVLNDAVKAVKTDLIVFLNSDSVLLTPESLKNLLEAFQDPATTAAFGRQLPRPDAETWVKRDYAASFPSTSPPSWMHLSLCFAAMRRSVWEKFPFYIDAWGSEDTQWGYLAKKRGEKVSYVPNALLMHSHNYTLKQLYGRRFIEGEADAFIFQKTCSIGSFAKDFIKGVVREFLLYFKKREWSSLKMIIPRRFVYSWAYYKGHRLGVRRRIEKDLDGSQGQKEVLKRYDD